MIASSPQVCLRYTPLKDVPYMAYRNLRPAPTDTTEESLADVRSSLKLARIDFSRVEYRDLA
ncbi:hypothetical protein RvY_18862 [Ramazzottius varieornatus]|uniref:Uncharacterized protein n=1 Tax=Ramazzottius varieornatus TaxID=947166 RepID=A0A1D1W7E4_RAMVA|nr:hypothetical protein RvY_18862 [Ramazzottius varieornatus]